MSTKLYLLNTLKCCFRSKQKKMFFLPESHPLVCSRECAAICCVWNSKIFRSSSYLVQVNSHRTSVCFHFRSLRTGYGDIFQAFVLVVSAFLRIYNNTFHLITDNCIIKTQFFAIFFSLSFGLFFSWKQTNETQIIGW